MSNKTPEMEKESTSQARANSPLGNNRSSLGCPINRSGLGTARAPRVVADGRGGEERREGRAAVVASS